MMKSDNAENIVLVKELLTRISAGQDILPLFILGATWWVPEGCALAGTYPVQDLLVAMKGLFAKFVAPPEFTLHHVTAEADRVAVFCESKAELLICT